MNEQEFVNIKELEESLNEHVLNNSDMPMHYAAEISMIMDTTPRLQHAVISYWVGEYEPAKTWLYDSEKEASEAMKRLYKKSFECAKEDENFEESECFIDETSAKVAWCDGLERWFEVSEVRTEEKI